MILEPRFTDDLADLPTHKFGPSSLTWWGIIAFMVIEGGFFMLTFAAYFFLMGHEQGWPPEGRQAPDVLAGTLFTIVIILSEIPNTMIKKAARAGDIPAIRRLILVMTAVGAILLVIRGFEYTTLNERWDTNAYGSILWAIMLIHTVHLATDVYDSLPLAAIVFFKPVDGRKFSDVEDNAAYWYFVAVSWFVLYALIYWVPRMTS